MIPVQENKNLTIKKKISKTNDECRIHSMSMSVLSAISSAKPVLVHRLVRTVGISQLLPCLCLVLLLGLSTLSGNSGYEFLFLGGLQLVAKGDMVSSAATLQQIAMARRRETIQRPEGGCSNSQASDPTRLGQRADVGEEPLWQASVQRRQALVMLDKPLGGPISL